MSATVFYSLTEGWSVLDSLYFSVVTGLTIGYGDLAPEQAVSKVFTMIYALLSVGLFVTFGTTLARAVISGRGRPGRTRHHKDDGSPTA
ncbi:two pore domain potassium channel family protein [Phytoactinopolyspora halotolerans]|uniref:Two pore domain potassium channel family protein n=1 Tax=Phytoactinopolyspora halotolerans TaxID=1981512 RepID=A0A6L9SA14_9ACTN|nr:two pore domain potassium channel family protein [Phytoactinopolyspora halotolerans]